MSSLWRNYVTRFTDAAASSLLLFCLLKLGKGLFGGLGFFAFGVDFEIGLEFGDGFVFLLHLLRDLTQGEVGGRVLGLNVDRIFGAEVGALIVFIIQIKLRDRKVFVDAFVVGLNSFDLGKFAMNGCAFGGIGRISRGGGVAGVGVGIVGCGTGAGAAAGVVAGKFGRRLRGEWMLGRGVRRSGRRGVGRVGGSGRAW